MSLLLKPEGRRYKLARYYTYKDVVVPRGYCTDGISYKLRLLGIILNKFDPLYIEAVVIHDWLTDEGDWEKGNRYFEEMLPDTLSAKCMVLGVKAYRKVKGY